MTYVPASRQAANAKASRIRKRIADGLAVRPEDKAWLEARGDVSRGRPKKLAQPAPKPEPPAPGFHSTPEPEPPVMSQPTQVDFGRPQEPMAVVDFGQPQEVLALSTPKQCNIPGCTHTPREHGTPRCGITGEKIYPPLRPNSRKAAANVGFAVVGFFIALAKGLDEAPDPTPGEVEDLSDAIGDIVSRRAPELGQYDDLLAGGYALTAYSIRAANAPKRHT